MKKILNRTDWHRNAHYEFFRQFEEPFFGITVQVDITHARQKAWQMQESLFLYYLYQSLRAVNAIEPFRYRIEGDDVVVYDCVHASPTINRENGSFGFAYMDFEPDWPLFSAKARQEVDRVRSHNRLEPATAAENVIHYSAIPWVHFTSLSHARAFSFRDSIPKISFGKIVSYGDEYRMPVSVHAHHALMDGYDVGRMLDLFQQFLNE